MIVATRRNLRRTLGLFAVGIIIVVATVSTVVSADTPPLQTSSDDISQIAAMISEEGECVTVSNPLVEQPKAVPVDLRATGGWLVPGESFLGSSEEAARAFDAELVGEAADDIAWLLTQNEGKLQATRLVLLTAEDGTRVWVTTTVVSVTQCPPET